MTNSSVFVPLPVSFIPFYTFPLELGASEMFKASTSFVLKNFGHLLPSVKCQADKHICFIKVHSYQALIYIQIPFQCKYHHSRYRYFHDNNKMVMWPSCLYNGNLCAENMVSLYWNGFPGSYPWWLHDMDMISILLTLCEGNPLITGGFSLQKASNAELWCFLWC